MSRLLCSPLTSGRRLLCSPLTSGRRLLCSPLTSGRRLLCSSTASKPAAEPKPQGVNVRHPGGIPDIIHRWGPGPFRQTGAGLIAASLASIPLSIFNEVGHLSALALCGLTALYWKVGLADLSQPHQALRRNFPVLIHIRYLLESVRPEVQQYLIESDDTAVPFSREMRTVIYQRAKDVPDTTALGTKCDVYGEGYEWASHSMFPVPVEQIPSRHTIGGAECSLPYSASILNISAMSYGALSGNAISALNLGAKQGGFYHNTGEGGISRFHLLGADVAWNLGTGYFACGDSNGPDGARRFNPEMFGENARREEVKLLEIKLSQGAKPAHGGMLPADKITEAIAQARGLGEAPWQDCNSPPRHTAFQTPKGLLLMVQALRELSGGKPIGFKFCVGNPVEWAALCHAMLDTGITPDFITVDGGEGGTGAAPLEFQNSVGMPLGEGLKLVNTMLVGANLRDKVTIIASGRVWNGFTLVRQLANGADMCNAARSFMFSLGCIQALKCNSNKCPTGITTQDPLLMSGLDIDSKAERVANFHGATVHAALEIIGALGCTSAAEVQPEHIFRRDSGVHVRTLNDLHDQYFPALGRGVLVNGKPTELPPKTRMYWEAGAELYHKTSAGGRAEHLSF